MLLNVIVYLTNIMMMGYIILFILLLLKGWCHFWSQIPTFVGSWVFQCSAIMTNAQFWLHSNRTFRHFHVVMITKETRQMCDIPDSLYDVSRKRGNAKIEKRFLAFKQTVEKEMKKQPHSSITSSQITQTETKMFQRDFLTYIKHKRSPAVSTVGPIQTIISDRLPST